MYMNLRRRDFLMWYGCCKKYCLQRMLKQFASDELIELNRGEILTKDFEGLKKIVG